VEETKGAKKGQSTTTYVSPAKAAEYAKEAATICSNPGHGCTTVVADLLDSETMVGYEEKYVAALKGWTFPEWGMHPYYAVKKQASGTVKAFKEKWGDGANSLWFTEVGAYNCQWKGEVEKEKVQREDAEYLVQKLIPYAEPEHVFYYSFFHGESRQPQTECEAHEAKEQQPDTALYVPTTDPNTPDRPRPAASYIWGNKSLPWGYTGGVSGETKPKVATVTGSVYPGGKLSASYHFEYWTSGGGTQYSGEGHTGSSEGEESASSTIEGLEPGTTYHYRLVAWNSEGSTPAGEEHTFSTPGPVEAETGGATGITQVEAVLAGEVNPNGYPAEFHFQYGKSTTYEHETAIQITGTEHERRQHTQLVSGLEPNTLYNFRIVATSGGVVAEGKDHMFVTPTPSIAFQAPTDALWLDSSTFAGGWTNTMLGMSEGSSPSVAMLPGGKYVVAFDAIDGSKTELWTYSSSGEYHDTALAMRAGTSPSVAALSNGSYEVAIDAANGSLNELWTYSPGEGGHGTTLGMSEGSSPSVAGLPEGKYVVAFNAIKGSSTELWTYSPSEGGRETTLGMTPHTSPSVTALPNTGGKYEIGVRASGGQLWKYFSSGEALNTTLEVRERTSPSIEE
jgi:hypothetical protein